MMYLCHFHQNLAIGSKDRVQTSLFCGVIFVPGDLEYYINVTKSNISFWLFQISICVRFNKIHQTVLKLERRQKATSQHRYLNHLMFHNFESLVILLR